MSPEYLYYLSYLQQQDDKHLLAQQPSNAHKTILRITPKTTPRITWTGPTPSASELLSGGNQAFKNKKWTTGKIYHSSAHVALASRSITNQIAPVPHSSSTLFLDLDLLQETVVPKKSASESAFSFCHNGTKVSVDIKKLVLHLHHSLKARNIILSDFNLIGGALQNILLHKAKKVGGDIDCLGHVRRVDGKKVTSAEVLDVVLTVLDEILFPSAIDQVTSRQERLEKFQKKHHVLKALFCNDDFLLVTIPLQLQDPNHPSKRSLVDLDIRINLEKELPSCIASVGCFEYDLLRLFRGGGITQITVTGSFGYETSVQEAFDLLQQRLFFVNKRTAAATTNGLRAYAILLVKGFFPIDYTSARVYFLKWIKECESGKDGVQLGVNHFFCELEKFVLRHYSLNGEGDVFALSLYLMNLRTTFSTQQWPERWAYNKEEFLNFFDEKAFFLLKKWMPDLTTCPFTVAQFILFWHMAGQSQEIFPIPHSQDVFACRNLADGRGLLTENPWQETLQCNWEELEQQMQAMRPYLEKMDLPLNSSQLKKVIADALSNHSHISASTLRSSLSENALQVQKTLKLGFHPVFDYTLFFSALLGAIKQSPELRAVTLRDLVRCIRHHHPENSFQHLYEAAHGDEPTLFCAMAKDLKESKEGQDKLCESLLNAFCDPFREQAVSLIFPHLNPGCSKVYFEVLWTAQERKRLGISTPVFHQLLMTALSSPQHLRAWKKTFNKKLPRFLEEAKEKNFPLSLVNAIGKFFCVGQNTGQTLSVNVLYHLCRLGYEPDFQNFTKLLHSETKLSKLPLTTFENYVVDKVFTTSLSDIWPELLAFTERYLHRFPINMQNQRDDKLLDAILFKIRMHSPVEEAIKMFTALTHKQNTPIPSLLNKYIETYHSMMEADLALYESKKAADLWGRLVMKISALHANGEPVDVKWVQALHAHFIKFKNIGLPTLTVHAFSTIATELGQDYLIIYTENLKKIANEAQGRDPTLFVQDWEETLKNLLGTNVKIEDCLEAYQLIMSKQNSSLISKDKRIEYFPRLQESMCVSAVKRQSRLPLNDFLNCVRLCHQNLMKGYSWVGVDNPLVNQNMHMHMHMLAETRILIDNPEVMKQTEGFSLDLLVWIKTNLRYLPQEAMKLTSKVGFINDFNIINQLFDHIVQFASKTTKENKTKTSSSDKDAIILHFIRGGLEQLILLNFTRFIKPFFSWFSEKHPPSMNLNTANMIHNLLDQLFNKDCIQPSPEEYSKMLILMEIILQIYTHPVNGRFLQLDQALHADNLTPGINKFIEIHKNWPKSPENEKGYFLIGMFQHLKTISNLYQSDVQESILERIPELHSLSHCRSLSR